MGVGLTGALGLATFFYQAELFGSALLSISLAQFSPGQHCVLLLRATPTALATSHPWPVVVPKPFLVGYL